MRQAFMKESWIDIVVVKESWIDIWMQAFAKESGVTHK